MSDWRIYRGAGVPHEGVRGLPEPPPWRDFTRAQSDTDGDEGDGAGGVGGDTARRLGARRRLVESLHPRPEEVEAVNAALYLRRPLLVTGNPGTGKSTLAHAVAHELGLGKVLRWPIVSRTTLKDGLYHYDAIGRLQDVQLDRAVAGQTAPSERPPIGSYLRLGPLGTALLPAAATTPGEEPPPRVLLVDELDKSDIDLPSDLLNVLEEGEFTIPELERIAEREPVTEVLTEDGVKVPVEGGKVRCTVFPFIVLTSNGERDFPAALLRRCIQLELKPPGDKQLAAMVSAHLGEEALEEGAELVQRFLRREPGQVIATDQLLNALFLTQRASGVERVTRERLAEMLLRPLDRPR
ncbi:MULTISPECIES: MoxR family ATPase [unclassified Streptomyces]|uniref:AAA family ATPase n=1 Tax=unclassified Streptomyces TaxID=2593676 RepID=UPI002DDB5120|nr:MULTISPECIES: MoxR family ATPase [unclassified Streptomyces]WSA92393.1 MoxR family ATPase [Streptomyces sp. NBC_01795]WSB76761.1 MoxR family ATPase [Streptomyces sp. NBC_01775]WSS14962.1 MoxR family ATPase [Streptomyces sp. NBC_01186]WSS43806.1 MoxR family ATPase [Streptomyces sp. NBC_01187]